LISFCLSAAALKSWERRLLMNYSGLLHLSRVDAVCPSRYLAPLVPCGESKKGRTYTIDVDSRQFGNLSRYINCCRGRCRECSPQPMKEANCELRVYVDMRISWPAELKNTRATLHARDLPLKVGVFQTAPIAAGEELLLDYGEDYWPVCKKRHKAKPGDTAPAAAAARHDDTDEESELPIEIQETYSIDDMELAQPQPQHLHQEEEEEQQQLQQREGDRDHPLILGDSNEEAPTDDENDVLDISVDLTHDEGDSAVCDLTEIDSGDETETEPEYETATAGGRGSCHRRRHGDDDDESEPMRKKRAVGVISRNNEQEVIPRAELGAADAAVHSEPLGDSGPHSPPVVVDTDSDDEDVVVLGVREFPPAHCPA
jgi:hypothetical protein